MTQAGGRDGFGRRPEGGRGGLHVHVRARPVPPHARRLHAGPHRYAVHFVHWIVSNIVHDRRVQRQQHVPGRNGRRRVLGSAEPDPVPRRRKPVLGARPPSSRGTAAQPTVLKRAEPPHDESAAGRELSLQPGRHAVHGRGTRARNGGGVDGEADETDHLGRGAHFVPNKNKTIFCEDVSNSLYRVI